MTRTLAHPASPTNPAPSGLSPLERAFQLARSGACRTVSEIRQRLKSEGLDARQIEGPALTRQLRLLCNAHRDGGAAGDRP